MPRMIASTLNVFRARATKQRPPYEEVWHLWSVLIPRRSITGRLVRGTVLRRRADVGKMHIGSPGAGCDDGDRCKAVATTVQPPVAAHHGRRSDANGNAAGFV